MPESARLFLALWPLPRLRAALLASQQQWHWAPRALPVPGAQLHLTLHYIGAVPRARLPELRAGLRVPCPAFALSLERPCLWRRGLAVLEPGTMPPGLLELHQALGASLAGLGLRVEARPFRPHVTLARRAANSRPPASITPLGWQIRGYVLVESAGGAYQVLERYACRTAGRA